MIDVKKLDAYGTMIDLIQQNGISATLAIIGDICGHQSELITDKQDQWVWGALCFALSSFSEQVQDEELMGDFHTHKLEKASAA